MKARVQVRKSPYHAQTGRWRVVGTDTQGRRVRIGTPVLTDAYYIAARIKAGHENPTDHWPTPRPPALEEQQS